MQPSAHRVHILLLGVALIALGAACSSSNNNKNNAPTSAAVSATAVSTAPAAVRTATPSVSVPPAAVRTATPAVAAVRTSTPSVAAARTATPSIASVAGTALAGLNAGDPAAQKVLAGAALQDTDLPAGFSANGAPDTNVTLPGQTASYSQTYTKIGQGTSGLDVQAVVVALTLFKDAATAQSQLTDLQNSLTQQSGADITLEKVDNGPKIGDQTLNFKVSGQTSGLSVAGFAIVWQEGKAGAALIQVGVPGIANIDALTPLAQKQDASLKAISK
jgi:hypothetical protein